MMKVWVFFYLMFECFDFEWVEWFFNDFGLWMVFCDGEYLFFWGMVVILFCYVVWWVEKNWFVGFGFEVDGIDVLWKFVGVLGVLDVVLLLWFGGGYCVMFVDLLGFCVDVVVG